MIEQVTPRNAQGRAASVAALRDRIASMGGIGTSMRHGVAGSAMASPRRPASVRVDPGQLGFEAETTPAGVAWVRRVSVDLGPFLHRAGATGPVPLAALGRLGCAAVADQASADHPWSSRPGASAMVLDIESLGLRGSGVLAFLVGVGVPRGDRLDIDQLLVADPGAEAAMLSALHARVASSTVLVSYNGRSFDVPMLVARSVINRLPATVFEERRHSDLLGPVRRLFRERLQGCTLRQCELGLLAFERVDDVPGYEAPGRYRAWLRGGVADVLEGVVRHNELDLCSTMVLAARVADHVDGRLITPVHPADRYHLGMHLERSGSASDQLRDEPAVHYRAAYEAEVLPWSRRAGHRLAHTLRRAAVPEAIDEAITILQHLWNTDPRDLRAARSLAILLERCGRIDEALSVAVTAQRSALTMPRWGTRRLAGEPPHGWSEDWRRRSARLGQRVERTRHVEASRRIAS